MTLLGNFVRISCRPEWSQTCKRNLPGCEALFALALVSAVLTVSVVVFAILAWRGRFWSARRRVHYTLVTLAALAFAWELVYWNLLGFRV